MIGAELLRTLVPHAGAMCLLQAVEDWGPDRILCTTRSHMMAEHPLRLNDQLSALHLIEYAAQAIAAHGALLAREQKRAEALHAQSGMLGSLRDVRFYVERIDTLDVPLTIDAQRRLAREDGMVYDFRAHAGAKLLCEGRAVIALQKV